MRYTEVDRETAYYCTVGEPYTVPQDVAIASGSYTLDDLNYLTTGNAWVAQFLGRFGRPAGVA